MDPAKYWMMARRKPGDQKAPAVFSAPHITVGGTSSASYYESWEERAFAEDSAGNLGGCIWPPRSYSCSFCGREFRSAQALGGHMNVHRRDRARLKLSGMAEDAGGDVHGMPLRQGYMVQQPLPCPPTTPRPSAPSTEANPNSVRSFLSDPGRSLVDAATARTIWGKQVLAAPLASPSDTQQEYGEKERFLHDAEQELRAGGGELKLSVLGCRTRSVFEDDNEDGGENIVHLSRKRRRIDLEATQFVLCTSSSEHLHHDDPHDDCDDDNNHHVTKVLKLCPSIPAEELDLELRL